MRLSEIQYMTFFYASIFATIRLEKIRPAIRSFGLDLLQVHLQQTVKLPGKIHGYPGMNGSLFVEKTLFPLNGKHTVMPDSRMNVHALPATAVKADKILGSDIVSGSGEGNDKWPVVFRKKQLTAIRMIIGMPQQQFFRFVVVSLPGKYRFRTVTQNIPAIDSIVFSIKNITLPAADKNAFDRTAFITTVGVMTILSVLAAKFWTLHCCCLGAPMSAGAFAAAVRPIR